MRARRRKEGTRRGWAMEKERSGVGAGEMDWGKRGEEGRLITG